MIEPDLKFNKIRNQAFFQNFTRKSYFLEAVFSTISSQMNIKILTVRYITNESLARFQLAHFYCFVNRNYL